MDRGIICGCDDLISGSKPKKWVDGVFSESLPISILFIMVSNGPSVGSMITVLYHVY